MIDPLDPNVTITCDHRNATIPPTAYTETRAPDGDGVTTQLTCPTCQTTTPVARITRRGFALRNHLTNARRRHDQVV